MTFQTNDYKVTFFAKNEKRIVVIKNAPNSEWAKEIVFQAFKQEKDYMMISCDVITE